MWSVPYFYYKLIIFYCYNKTSIYSINSVLRARKNGYTNVVRYAAGINGWKKREQQVKKDDPCDNWDRFHAYMLGCKNDTAKDGFDKESNRLIELNKSAQESAFGLTSNCK